MLEKTYRVDFFHANGAFLGGCRVSPGQSARWPLPTPPKGWRFDRWEPQVSFVLADTRATAVFVPKEYPVTFLSETGAVLKREYVPHGQDATPPPYISKTKGCPASWSGRITNIQHPQVFCAVFERQLA